MIEDLSEMTVEEKIASAIGAMETLDPVAFPDEVSALISIRTMEELRELALQARGRTFKTRYAVVQWLGRFRYDGVIAELISLLNDENALIAAEAGRGLDRMDSEVKYDMLMPLLASESIAELHYAISALGRGERSCAVLPLIELLNHPHDGIVYESINALRQIGDRRSDRYVAPCLGHRCPEVRYAAAFYCGSRRVKSSSRALSLLFDDENDRIRQAAIWALGQIEGVRESARLESLLAREKSDNVRNKALRLINSKKLTSRAREGKMPQADICLFMEDEYNCKSDSISQWSHDLIEHFKDLSFSLVHISTARSEMREFSCGIPANVVYLQESGIHEVPDSHPGKKRKLEKTCGLLYDLLFSWKEKSDAELAGICSRLGIPGSLEASLAELLFSWEAWEFLQKIYGKGYSDIPFLEFNRSFRSMLLPLYSILQLKIPPARLYYSTKTGYAGIAAVLAKIHYRQPMMLTEHTIHHHEKMLEISRAGWSYLKEDGGYVACSTSPGLRRLWISLHETLSALAYRYADTITTLFRDNLEMQVQAGADRTRIRIIPDGIDYLAYNIPGRVRPDTFTVASVGPLVPDLDIKTFIRAAHIVRERFEGAVNFLVLRSASDDGDYADQCRALTRMLGLQDTLVFDSTTGIEEYLPSLDLLVHTGIKENLPLPLMKAMAAGIPCVASDTGACEELINGRDDDDRRYGPCGRTTAVRSPFETAAAIMEILSNQHLYASMSATGRERIARHYEKRSVYEAYGKEFDALLSRTH